MQYARIGFENVRFVMLSAVHIVVYKTTVPHASGKSDLGKFYLQCECNQKFNRVHHEQRQETFDLSAKAYLQYQNDQKNSSTSLAKMNHRYDVNKILSVTISTRSQLVLQQSIYM